MSWPLFLSFSSGERCEDPMVLESRSWGLEGRWVYIYLLQNVMGAG